MDILENRAKNSKQRYVENIPLLARKLRELRERLGWTRQYLSAKTKGEDTIGLSVRQIQRAENCEKGVSLGCYHRIAKALGTKLDDLLEETGLKWNVPYPRNPFFTGREEVLAQLRDVLAAGKAVLTQPQAISGLGGIGKTQTAVEYAYRYCNDYKAVLWTKADSKEAITSGFVSIAKLLSISEQNEQEQGLVVAAVKCWLETNNDWLLIFDNADEPQFLENFIPNNLKGHILLTSRSSSFAHLRIHPIQLDKMTPTEAKEFPLKRTGRDFVSLQPKEVEAIEQLTTELDYFPLALEQAAAYITQLESSFQNYLSSFHKRGLGLLDKTGKVAGGYPFSVTTTWALNFEKVEQESHIAADLLRVSAFLHPDQIPIELLTLGAEEINSELSSLIANVDGDPLILDEALAPLTRYSLIRRDPTTQTYSIHRLVQAVLKERLSQTEQSQWAERAVRAVNAAFPEVDFPNWHLCERLLPHAQICSEHIEKWKFEFEEAARLLNRVGRYLHDRIRLNEAKPFLKRALAIREKVLGLNHLDTAQSLYNLGRFYHTQHKFTEAEKLLKKALAIRKKILGLNHLDTADSLSKLGRLYFTLGKTVEAEQLYKRALEIQKQMVGLRHPETAHNLISLGSIYCRWGKYNEAEPLYQQGLVIFEEFFGVNHPDTAYSLHYLGLLYHAQGKLSKAKPLLELALTIREKILGLYHPSTAICLNHLAQLYEAQGKLAEAEGLYQRMIETIEKSPVPEYSYLVGGLKNYADLLRRIGRHAEAERLESRAKKIDEKIRR